MNRIRRITVLGLFLAAGLAGCGRETYLERFDETKRYFAYEDKLNQYLTRVAWAGKSFQIRVPKQFQPIAAKIVKKGEEEADEKDPRQPKFAELEFAGLQGAWQASFPLTGGAGSGEGYLYLCSNYDLLAKKGDEERAKAFNGDVIQRCATAFGQQATTPLLSKTPIFEFPPKAEEAWVEKRKFHVLSSPGIPALVNDKPYRVRIYSYKKEKSPAQISLVYILPDNIVQASALDKAIDLSLETLVVTQKKPPTGTAKGAKSGKGKPPGAGAL